VNEFDLDFKAFLRRHRDLSSLTLAVLCRVGHPTRNGHIYPQEVIARELARLAAQPGGVIGYLPHMGNTALENAAFLVERPRIVHDSVQGTLKFLDTHAGSTLKAYMEAGGNIAFTTEGVGSVDEHGIVQNDFHLSGIIATPQPGAYLSRAART
jgi:hypothetical protein